MICLIAPTLHQAERWADSQYLESNEWFYAKSEQDLLGRMNFHTIVAPHHFPEDRLWLFERLYATARQRGKMGRK